MKIVLYQPQIPQNTGNIIRTCAVTGCGLVLVEPMGFSINDRWLKRAGLDYAENVHIEVIQDLLSYLENCSGSFHLFSSKATTYYTQKTFAKNDLLIFGSETEGLPLSITTKYSAHCVKIPMQSGVRCLNLATSVGIGVYEAWRQQSFL